MEANLAPSGFQRRNCPNSSDAPERLICNSSSAENKAASIQYRVTWLRAEIFGPNQLSTKIGNFGTMVNLMNVNIAKNSDKMEYYDSEHKRLGYLTFDVTFNKGLFYQGELQGAESISKKLLPFYKVQCPSYNLYNCLDRRDQPSTFNFIEDLYRDAWVNKQTILVAWLITLSDLHSFI